MQLNLIAAARAVISELKDELITSLEATADDETAGRQWHRS
ncbi:hypothetical protein [Chromobacterium sp.]